MCIKEDSKMKTENGEGKVTIIVAFPLNVTENLRLQGFILSASAEKSEVVTKAQHSHIHCDSIMVTEQGDDADERTMQ